MDLYKLFIENQPKETMKNRLKRELSKITKHSNPAYINAIKRNKKQTLYNEMILKLRAEIHDSKKADIIAKYLRKQAE